MERNGRQHRIHLANTIHHVMMRGNNRQRIFFGSEYFHRFLEIIDESTDKFDHKILSYCLMTNHIHLIVKINDSPLSAVMQNINFRYARWTNQQLAHIGHLFQARYRSIEVNNEAYLVNLCRYIHLNPVEAKIVSNVDHYKWSSHKNYICNYASKWLDVSTISNMINDKTQLNYADFICKKDIDRDEWKPALSLSASGSLIINDSIMKNANLSLENNRKKPSLPINVVESIFLKHLMINQDELYAKNKNYEISKKRALLISYWLKYSDIKLSEISRLFERTQSTLRRQICQITSASNEYFPRILLQKIDSEIQDELNRKAI